MFNWVKPNILSWLVCKSGPDKRSMFEPFLRVENSPNNITDRGSTAKSSVKPTKSHKLRYGMKKLPYLEGRRFIYEIAFHI